MHYLKTLNEQGIDWEGNLLSHALFYAQTYGWQIVPLHTPIFDEEGKPATRCSCGKADHVQKDIGKHPRWHETLLPNGLKNATSDTEKIKEWWNLWPDANIAVVTGIGSNLAVLDADGAKGKRTLLGLPDIPMTACVQSGVGLHYYFLHPGEGRKVKTTVGVMPGIDSRGDGGYVVAPPSLHWKGYRYEWLDAVELSHAPDWWLDLVEKPPVSEGIQGVKFEIEITDPHIQAYGRVALQNELARLWSCPIGQGKRNKTLYSAAWAVYQLVGAGCIEDDLAYDCLRQAAIDGMKMNPAEAEKTIRSGRNWGLKNPRKLELKNGELNNAN